MPTPPPDASCRACISYALAALDAECQAVETTPEGARNDRLNVAAFNLGQLTRHHFLNEEDVVKRLYDVGIAAGLTERETRATVLSGITKGSSERNARDLAEVHAQHGLRLVPESTKITSLGNVETVELPEPVDLARRILEQEIARQRTLRAARRALDEEEALAAFRVPPFRSTLTAELEIEDEDMTFRVAEVMPTGANVLLTAQYKTGKTTLLNDLAACLADGHAFLGRYEVTALKGRVALVNYEVDERQFRRWLRALEIENTEAVTVLNLRGFTMPLVAKQAQDWMVEWLIQNEVYIWIADPFARAYVGSGTSENDNAEVSRFLDALDVIKYRAGIQELVLATHTGRGEMEEGQERARGATRLDDWCDARWLLTKDQDDHRYFRATGRDVEVEEAQLQFDAVTRRLTLSGQGNRKQSKNSALESAILHVIEATPGISLTQLRVAVRQIVHSSGNQLIDQTVDRLRFSYRIRVEEGGQGRPNRHFPVTPRLAGGD